MQFQNFMPQQQLQTLFGNQTQQPANMQGLNDYIMQQQQQRWMANRQSPITMATVSARNMPFRFNVEGFRNNRPEQYQQYQQQFGLQQALQQMFPQYAQAVPSLFGNFRRY